MHLNFKHRLVAGIAVPVTVVGILSGCGGSVASAQAAGAPSDATTAGNASGPANNNTGAGGGPRGSGRPQGSRSGFNLSVATEAAAQALNMQPSDLQQQLRSGKSLQDIATAQHVDITKVETVMTDAAKPQLDQAVKNGSMTAQQEQQILSRMASGQMRGGGGGGNFARGSRSPAPAAAG